MGHFAAVPLEVLIHIMAFLPLRDLAVCSTLVCKSWHTLLIDIPTLWRCIELPRFASLLPRIPLDSVQALDLRNVDPKTNLTQLPSKSLFMLRLRNHKRIVGSALTELTRFLDPTVTQVTISNFNWTASLDSCFKNTPALLDSLVFDPSCENSSTFGLYWHFFGRVRRLCVEEVILSGEFYLCIHENLVHVDVTIE
ncbi:hypothetical protein HDU98_000534, partial [Podochytrium sp. JEL0797]